MATLKIDLKTRILSDKMQVHLVRPGARYAFYEHVRQLGYLPADVPMLEETDPGPIPEADEIEDQLERARLLRSWAKQSTNKRGRRPGLELERYSTGLALEAGAQATRTKLRNNANSILHKIPGGTLVLVPAKNLSGKALMAEIYSRKAKRKVVEGVGHYNGLKFVARRLRNVQEVPMISLPSSLLESAKTMRVVQKIEGHAEDSVLRLYYGDYQRDSDFVAGVQAGTENFDARIVGQMIELHMAVEHFLATRQTITPGTSLIDPAVTSAPYFHANINSPDGRAFLESRQFVTFVVKLIMVVAATAGDPAAAGDLIAQGLVTVENSAEPKADPRMLEASRNAMIDFFATSGQPSYTAYLEALQDGLNRNATSLSGSSEIKP